MNKSESLIYVLTAGAILAQRKYPLLLTHGMSVDAPYWCIHGNMRFWREVRAVGPICPN